MEIDKEMNEALGKIFMPYAHDHQQQLAAAGGRLVHYTTADGAVKILRSKSLWLRNALVMHDFSEIQHGHNRLLHCLGADRRAERFANALNACAPNIADEVARLFDSFWYQTRTQTYIACLSEHDAAEDTHGRLSMWRTFGQQSIGIALVFKVPPAGVAVPLKVFLSPVAYLAQAEYLDQFDRVLRGIEAQCAYLQTVPRQTLLGFAYMMLMMATVSLKHEAFREEREWRLIYAPQQFYSPYMLPEQIVVGGVPQTVHPLRFVNRPNDGIAHIELPELIDRIIIGPSQYSLPIRDALIQELNVLGVLQADAKVIMSGIPIRG